MYLKAIRENKILAKISEFTAFELLFTLMRKAHERVGLIKLNRRAAVVLQQYTVTELEIP